MKALGIELFPTLLSKIYQTQVKLDSNLREFELHGIQRTLRRRKEQLRNSASHKVLNDLTRPFHLG